ncbi:MAG: hypothetical protein HY308_15605 [Gammaproteobacteria bacterium]|nr:hypothetical protein [Gammaproteobacteria bacterium]
MVLAGLLLTGTANAAGEFGLGVKAGTLGFGLEGIYSLSEQFNLRGGFNKYSHDGDEDASGIRYDGELDLQTAGLMLDWHPFSGTFRISIGIFNNQNEVTLTATPTSDQTIGGSTFTASEIGTLSGKVEFKKTAPYLGIGWGNAVGKGNRFSFNFELGALFQGSADVTLSSDGTLADDSTYQAALRTEEQEAEDDLDDFKIYPVIAFGMSYRF